MEFFGNQKNKILFSLISKLNKIPNVISCGGVGLCFNCRNKQTSLPLDPSLDEDTDASF